MHFTSEHNEIRRTAARFVETELNPHVDAWEEAEEFPSHEIFKKLGDLGLLGIKYDPAYGGLGLDFSYSMVMAEEIGLTACGGVPMGIGVQTDMCTPALNRYGSDHL
ncbi:MAG: acyl-CoA dehydrogenase family protein, partial [Rhizobiaceae bacterium]|nr:acyl-CoA dehydrogenase family protein [Rhizobiaceae bacterium]